MREKSNTTHIEKTTVCIMYVLYKVRAKERVYARPHLTTSSVLWILVCIDPNTSVPNLLRSLAHRT